MRTSIFALALAAALPVSAPALARDLPDGGVTVGEFADALQSKGFKAEIGKDAQGDPKITSAADGSSFTVFFYGCEKNRCKSVQFSSGFDMKSGMALSEVNKWHSDYRFGRVYLDDDNDPYLTMDEDLEHGATDTALENNIERWEATLVGFKKFIKW